MRPIIKPAPMLGAILAAGVCMGGFVALHARAHADVPDRPVLSGPPPAAVAKPYDTQQDAHAAVAAAFAEAKKSGRKVLLDFGGNWCPDCRIMAGILEAPEVEPWVKRHFVTVPIDVGRYDKNLDIEQRFNVPPKGVPTVLVVTADGKLLNPDAIKELTDARHMSPQAVVDLLVEWNKRG
ncbi:thioredoxin family protein [Rhizosaccharibacter radicis]|uniref:Thioredoxin family protein n=1 Tax=Rhizosaccharibacter radicis TaxID=2782605 RepID=A0ABT1W1I3_9PROT|nr:thioredoxin family protein [Acetobacteraceae bacterium KSS12]